MSRIIGVLQYRGNSRSDNWYKHMHQQLVSVHTTQHNPPKLSSWFDHQNRHKGSLMIPGSPFDLPTGNCMSILWVNITHLPHGCTTNVLTLKELVMTIVALGHF